MSKLEDIECRPWYARIAAKVGGVALIGVALAIDLVVLVVVIGLLIAVVAVAWSYWFG